MAPHYDGPAIRSAAGLGDPIELLGTGGGRLSGGEDGGGPVSGGEDGGGRLSGGEDGGGPVSGGGDGGGGGGMACGYSCSAQPVPSHHRT